jgi:hypothetical protein
MDSQLKQQAQATFPAMMVQQQQPTMPQPMFMTQNSFGHNSFGQLTPQNSPFSPISVGFHMTPQNSFALSQNGVQGVNNAQQCMHSGVQTVTMQPVMLMPVDMSACFDASQMQSVPIQDNQMQQNNMQQSQNMQQGCMSNQVQNGNSEDGQQGGDQMTQSQNANQMMPVMCLTPLNFQSGMPQHQSQMQVATPVNMQNCMQNNANNMQCNPMQFPQMMFPTTPGGAGGSNQMCQNQNMQFNQYGMPQMQSNIQMFNADASSNQMVSPFSPATSGPGSRPFSPTIGKATITPKKSPLSPKKSTLKANVYNNSGHHNCHGSEDGNAGPAQKKRRFNDSPNGSTNGTAVITGSNSDPRVAARLRVRGTLFSMLRKIQTANLRILRWSRLRALKGLESALQSQEISPEEHAFLVKRVAQECATAAMRVVNQHAREHIESFKDQSASGSLEKSNTVAPVSTSANTPMQGSTPAEDGAVTTAPENASTMNSSLSPMDCDEPNTDANQNNDQSPAARKPVCLTYEEVVKSAENDLGEYLSGLLSLRGSVRLLVDCLKDTPVKLWAKQIFEDQSFRCRLSTPVTHGIKMFSRLHHNLAVGEIIHASGPPFMVDGQQRVRVRLDNDEDGYVSIRNNDKFFLLERFDMDEADIGRWVNSPHGADEDVAGIFECLRPDTVPMVN